MLTPATMQQLRTLDDKRALLLRALNTVKRDVATGRRQPDESSFILCLEIVEAYCAATQVALDTLLECV